MTIFQDKLLKNTGCDEAGDYVVSNVLSPNDLVFRHDINCTSSKELVKFLHHSEIKKFLFAWFTHYLYTVPVKDFFYSVRSLLYSSNVCTRVNDCLLFQAENLIWNVK